MAPEVLQDQLATKMVDYWYDYCLLMLPLSYSLFDCNFRGIGIIMFELLYGRLPWGEEEDMDPVDLFFTILTQPIVYEEADANGNLILHISEHAKHLMSRFLHKVWPFLSNL
jgi:serine/threonine protein kinase